MTTVAKLYERLQVLPAPRLGRRIGDFVLYEALLAGCADRLAHGSLLDLSTVPMPDEGTLSAVAALRAKAALSEDERLFLEYFDLLEEIRLALGGAALSERL